LELLERLPGHRVVVVGDVMLDEYLLGSVKRVSPEAPVLVVDVERMTWAPGGAANVAANIRALGGEVSLVGLVGKDHASERLRGLLEEMGVLTDGLIEDSKRDTSLKTRIIAGHQQVVRVDREQREKPEGASLRKLKDKIAEKLEESEAIVVSDYDKGVIGQATLDAVRMTRQSGKFFSSNPKPQNLRWFHGAHLLTLNQVEAEAASGETIDSEKAVQKAGKKILERTDADWVIITRGANGLDILGKDGQSSRVPGMPVEVFDVAGAGDTVVSALTLAMAAGSDIGTAARLANYAAATVVRKLGVASAVPSEVAHLIKETEQGTE